MLVAEQEACFPWNVSWKEPTQRASCQPVQRGSVGCSKGAGAKGISCEQSAKVCITHSRGWCNGRAALKGFGEPVSILPEIEGQHFGTCLSEGPQVVLQHYLWRLCPFPQISCFSLHVAWEEAQGSNSNSGRQGSKEERRNHD